MLKIWSKFSGTVLVENIVSSYLQCPQLNHLPPPSVTTFKTPPYSLHISRHSSSFSLCFFLDSELYLVKSKEFDNQGMKVQAKRAFIRFFKCPIPNFKINAPFSVAIYLNTSTRLRRAFVINLFWLWWMNVSQHVFPSKVFKSFSSIFWCGC